MKTRSIAKTLAFAVMAAGAALAAGGAAAATYTMKIGHPLPPRTGLHVWGEYVKKGVETRSKGAIEVKIFPQSQLGAMPRMIEGAQFGTIEMIEVPPAFLSGVDPRYSVLAAPGIFDSLRHGQRTVHDPEFKKVFWNIGEPKGLKLVGLTCEAPSDYATVTPIRKLADFKGRKLRVFGSKLEIETLRRLGATGVPMPLTEVVPALQQRAIDGNKAGISVFVPFKYQNVAKYVLRAKESLICVTKFASKLWFDKLPGDLQKIVLEESAKADDRILPWNEAAIERLYGIWQKTGGVLTDLSPDEQAELIRRLASVGDDVLKERPQVLKVFQVLKASAARNRGKK